MTNLVFFVTLLLSITVARAQRTISAQVIDKGTGVAISEANIRLEDASIGVITNEKGRFLLPVKEAEAGSNLVISHIGYQTQKIPLVQVSTEIQLDEQVYQIGEIAVRYVDLRKLLIKKWKIDDNSIDNATGRILENLKKKNPEKYEKLAKRPDSMKEAVKLIRLVFHENGTAKVKALLFFGQSYEWQFDESSRTISIIDKEGHEHNQTIIELTDTHLILKSTTSEGILSETGYVPVN